MFAENFTAELTDNIPKSDAKGDQDSTKMNDIAITEEEVNKLLKDLQVNKSAGPDQINPRVLYECADVLSKPLTVLFNKSLTSGIVPKDWKMAHICPIHKKDEKHMASNYRPVSLTSVVSKVMERVVKERIMNYLYSNNKLSDCQYGFVEGRNTVTNLLHATDAWTESVDRGENVDVLLLDFKKAFDSVPHKRLLEKCRGIGLSDQCIVWLSDFLKERWQKVKVGSCLSSAKEVRSGVPQGSVVGPVLFVIFINDLPDGIKGKITMFADDVKLFRIIRSIHDCQELQSDLDKLYDWSVKWQLHFNPKKCQVLRIGNPPPYNYSIVDVTSGKKVLLKSEMSARDLGVTHSADLKHERHVKEIVAKATKVCFTIKRTIGHLTPDSGRALFCALARPILEYAATSWSPYHQKDIQAIEKVQRRFTKWIRPLRSMQYRDRLVALNLFSLRHRRRRGDLIQMYLLKSKEDQLVSRHLARRTPHNTRGHQFKLETERTRLCQRRYYFTNRVRKDWNSLPQNIVEAPNLDTFKRRLDRRWENDPTRFE